MPCVPCEQSEPAAAKRSVCAIWDLAAKPVVLCRSLMVSGIPSSISSCLQRRKPTRRAPAATSILAMTPLWTSTCQTRTSECCFLGCIMQRHPGTMAQARRMHHAPCCRAGKKPGKVSQHCVYCRTLPCSKSLALLTQQRRQTSSTLSGACRQAPCMMSGRLRSTTFGLQQVHLPPSQTCGMNHICAGCCAVSDAKSQKHPVPSAACWGLFFG